MVFIQIYMLNSRKANMYIKSSVNIDKYQQD